jgi:hypothetical protein
MFMYDNYSASRDLQSGLLRLRRDPGSVTEAVLGRVKVPDSSVRRDAVCATVSPMPCHARHVVDQAGMLDTHCPTVPQSSASIVP